jgi:hypothetical protein
VPHLGEQADVVDKPKTPKDDEYSTAKAGLGQIGASLAAVRLVSTMRQPCVDGETIKCRQIPEEVSLLNITSWRSST